MKQLSGLKQLHQAIFRRRLESWATMRLRWEIPGDNLENFFAVFVVSRLIPPAPGDSP